MKRREAIQNIGLSLGTITMSSTVVGLLTNCTTREPGWTPGFFSAEEGKLVTKTLDLIIPPTKDIPGASDLNLAQFVDGYLQVISSAREREAFKAGMGKFLANTLQSSGKTEISGISESDLTERLDYYLKADPGQQAKWNTEISEAGKPGGNAPSDDAVNFGVLKSLRGRGISAFKMSRQIGEEVLAYDPVPGRQKGCIDLEEATGGKAWSL